MVNIIAYFVHRNQFKWNAISFKSARKPLNFQEVVGGLNCPELYMAKEIGYADHVSVERMIGIGMSYEIKE